MYMCVCTLVCVLAYTTPGVMCIYMMYPESGLAPLLLKTNRQTNRPAQQHQQNIDIGRLTLRVSNGSLKVLLQPANSPCSSNIVHNVYMYLEEGGVL